MFLSAGRGAHEDQAASNIATRSKRPWNMSVTARATLAVIRVSSNDCENVMFCAAVDGCPLRLDRPIAVSAGAPPPVVVDFSRRWTVVTVNDCSAVRSFAIAEKTVYSEWLAAMDSLHLHLEESSPGHARIIFDSPAAIASMHCFLLEQQLSQSAVPVKAAVGVTSDGRILVSTGSLSAVFCSAADQRMAGMHGGEFWLVPGRLSGQLLMDVHGRRGLPAEHFTTIAHPCIAFLPPQTLEVQAEESQRLPFLWSVSDAGTVGLSIDEQASFATGGDRSGSKGICWSSVALERIPSETTSVFGSIFDRSATEQRFLIFLPREGGALKTAVCEVSVQPCGAIDSERFFAVLANLQPALGITGAPDVLMTHALYAPLFELLVESKKSVRCARDLKEFVVRFAAADGGILAHVLAVYDFEYYRFSEGSGYSLFFEESAVEDDVSLDMEPDSESWPGCDSCKCHDSGSSGSREHAESEESFDGSAALGTSSPVHQSG